MSQSDYYRVLIILRKFYSPFFPLLTAYQPLIQNSQNLPNSLFLTFLSPLAPSCSLTLAFLSGLLDVGSGVVTEMAEQSIALFSDAIPATVLAHAFTEAEGIIHCRTGKISFKMNSNIIAQKL